ncbi:MAG: O-antigen ligase family protein [Lacipirellulaceae bacterium]
MRQRELRAIMVASETKANAKVGWPTASPRSSLRNSARVEGDSRQDRVDPSSPRAPEGWEKGENEGALRLLMVLVASLLLRPWDYIPALAAIRPVTLMLVGISIYVATTGVRMRLLSLALSRPLLTLWGAMLVTAPLSYWPAHSLELAVKYGQQVILFSLIGSVVVAAQSLYRLTSVAVVCGVVVAFQGLYAYATGNVAADNRISGVGQGFLGDPNELANTLAAVLPLAWWMALHGNGVVERVAARVALGPVLAGILVTQSRGGLLSLGAAVAVMLIGSRPRLGPPALFLLLLGGLTIALLPTEAIDRFATITNTQVDESAQARLAVWKAGFRMFGDHVVTGVGMGCFADVYGQYYIDREGAGNVWRAAHNSVVEVAGELGIVGLGAWLTLVVGAFAWQGGAVLAMGRMKDRSPAVGRLAQWSVAMLASLCGFVVGAMFLSRAYDLTLIMLVSLATAASTVALRAQQAASARVGA